MKRRQTTTVSIIVAIVTVAVRGRAGMTETGIEKGTIGIGIVIVIMTEAVTETAKDEIGTRTGSAIGVAIMIAIAIVDGTAVETDETTGRGLLAMTVSGIANEILLVEGMIAEMTGRMTEGMIEGMIEGMTEGMTEGMMVVRKMDVLRTTIDTIAGIAHETVIVMTKWRIMTLMISLAMTESFRAARQVDKSLSILNEIMR